MGKFIPRRDEDIAMTARHQEGYVPENKNPVPEDVIETLEICATDESVDVSTYTYQEIVTPRGIYVYEDANGARFGVDAEAVYTTWEGDDFTDWPDD